SSARAATALPGPRSRRAHAGSRPARAGPCTGAGGRRSPRAACASRRRGASRATSCRDRLGGLLGGRRRLGAGLPGSLGWGLGRGARHDAPVGVAVLVVAAQQLAVGAGELHLTVL